MGRTTPDKMKLYGIAESQQGLFTTKQAKACGYAENTHPYHVKVGNWQREYRGIYRLVHFPMSEEEQLVLWSLWSMNRNEESQGVYSHLTALSIHELSDAMPAQLDLTVPKSFRRFKEPPPILHLHKADLAETDIQRCQGYRVTTPVRTLIDVANEVSVPEDILMQAVRDGAKKGILLRSVIRQRKNEFPERLEKILSKVYP